MPSSERISSEGYEIHDHANTYIARGRVRLRRNVCGRRKKGTETKTKPRAPFGLFCIAPSSSILPPNYRRIDSGDRPTGHVVYPPVSDAFLHNIRRGPPLTAPFPVGRIFSTSTPLLAQSFRPATYVQTIIRSFRFRKPDCPQISRARVHTRRIVRMELREPVRRPGVGQQRGIGGRHVELQARRIG